MLSKLAQTLLRLRRRYKPRKNPADPRILVIRRNRMGDMIYTLPLLHALRRHYPRAHIAVACDPPGAPIAGACAAVNEVIVLERSRLSVIARIKNAARLQKFDWVVAAKGGYDQRLAALVKATGAAIRIGFVRNRGRSPAYTDPVALPEDPYNEHQIETLLRLLQPLGVAVANQYTVNLDLTLPEPAEQFAATLLAPLGHARFMLVNLSSTASLRFRDEDFAELIIRILATTDLTLGIVAAPADQAKAAVLANRMASARVTAMATPGPLDLAAVLQKAVCLFTPEGGAAHLAAAMGTPALVLWSEGPFEKWHSRADNHAFVRAGPKEKTVPVERVWQALQPMLQEKK